MSAQLLSVEVNPQAFMPIKQMQKAPKLMQINRNLPPIFINADTKPKQWFGDSELFKVLTFTLVYLALVAAVVS